MANGETATPTVPVAELRVGMYIHLDLGWMRHPFPLSHFKLESEQQIATVRGLGLTHVRWDPALSEGASALTDPTSPKDAPTVRAEDTSAPARPEASERERLAPVLGGELTGPSAEDERQRQRVAALHLCQRQYDEAAAGVRSVWSRLGAAPGEAAAEAAQLCSALLDKMLVNDDLCLRLLPQVAPERPIGHALNVAMLALLLGRALALPRDELEPLGLGALLHDVGKEELPSRVRTGMDGWSAHERQLYQHHVALGVARGKRMSLSPMALLVMAQHHEHADGSGYPGHLSGERIVLSARIVALVNRFDSLCQPAPGGIGLTPHEALSQLFSQERQHFDAGLLNAFIRMMGVYPLGSVVQLTDDRYALVTSVNLDRPLRPQVMVHEPHSPVPRPLALDAEPDLGIRRSLKPSQLPPVAREVLQPRSRWACFPQAAQGAELAASRSG